MLTIATTAATTAATRYLDKVEVGLDVAASEFLVEGENAYDLDFKTSGPDKDHSMKLSGDEMKAFYMELIRDYPIVRTPPPLAPRRHR